MFMVKLIIALVILLFAWPCWGATYYMSANGTAVDKEAASGPCGTQANCMTIATRDGEGDVYSGDDIFEYCDDDGIYRDQLDIQSSGTSGHPIIHRAASGDTPIINGSDVISGNWTGPDGNGEYKDDSVSTECFIVVVDDTIWLEGTIASLGATEWGWNSDDGGTLFLGADPAALVVEAGQRLGITTNDKDYITIDGIDFNNCQGTTDTAASEGGSIFVSGDSDYITIQNCDIDRGHGYGIAVRGATNVTIDSNTIDNIESQQGGLGGDGIYVSWVIATEKTPSTIIISNNTIGSSANSIDRQAIAVLDVDGCNIYSNTINGGQIGIDCEPNPGNMGCDSVNIYLNIINKVPNTRGSTVNHGIAASGANSSTVVIRNNNIDINDPAEGKGIIVGGFGGADCLIYKNKIIDARRGIDVTADTDWDIYSNFIKAGSTNHVYGIDLSVAGSVDLLIYNNIITGFDTAIWENAGDTTVIVYGNTLANYNYGMYWDSEATNNWTVKNNIFGDTTPGNKHIRVGTDSTAVIDYNLYAADGAGYFHWKGSNYNWADWLTNSSQDANSPTPADPLFTNAGADNFTLRSGSPCINTGYNLDVIDNGSGNTYHPICQRGSSRMGMGLR